MEFHSNAEYLSAFPPKLEDAGLEDCALPIERIQVWSRFDLIEFSWLR